jgi:hypothetical protein
MEDSRWREEKARNALVAGVVLRAVRDAGVPRVPRERYAWAVTAALHAAHDLFEITLDCFGDEDAQELVEMLRDKVAVLEEQTT